MENWQGNLYIAALSISLAISAILFVYARRRYGMYGVTPFLAICATAALWSATKIYEVSSVDLQGRVFWADLQFIWYVLLPTAYFALALQYCGYDRYLTTRHKIFFAIIPALTALFLLTNKMHGLMWRNVYLVTSGGFISLEKTHGPWFWVPCAYSYMLTAFAAFVMIHTLFRAHSIYRNQTLALLLGLGITLCSNVMFVLFQYPSPQYDLTPVALGASGLVTAWALLRYGLFDIVPVARDRVIESLSDSVIVLDYRHRIVDLNPSAERLIGYTASECIGQKLALKSDEWPEILASCANPARVQRQISLDVDGLSRFFNLSIAPLATASGKADGCLVVIRDITESRRIEEALRQSEERYKTIFDNTGTAMLILDNNDRISTANSTFRRLFGYSHDELEGRRQADMIYRDEQDVSISEYASGPGDTTDNDEYSINDKAGNARCVILNRAQIAGGEESVVSLVDITERRRTEDFIRRMAYNDYLTGIPNIAFFQSRLTQEVSRASRHDEMLAVMFLDLDGFKVINDTYGHDTGDKTLCRVAGKLNDMTRICDMVARIGGDEFIILLTDVKSLSDILAYAKRLVSSFNTPIRIEGNEFMITVSVGISMYPRHGATTETLLKRADYAMYVAKRLGGNRYFVYNNEDDDITVLAEPDDSAANAGAIY